MIFLVDVSGFFLRRVSEDYQAHCRVQLAKDFPDVSAEVLQKFLLRNKNLYLRSFRALQDHCKLEGHELGIPGQNNYLVFCKFIVIKLFYNFDVFQLCLCCLSKFLEIYILEHLVITLWITLDYSTLSHIILQRSKSK